MLWLQLLGIATLLTIAVRRARQREEPLDDQVYLSRVAVDHLQTGVAWVKTDGSIGFVNPAFASALGVTPGAVTGHNWLEVFAGADRVRAEEIYQRMQFAGLASFQITGSRGTKAPLDLLLVAVYDAKGHFRGHHCILADRVRERELEERLRQSIHAGNNEPDGSFASRIPMEARA